MLSRAADAIYWMSRYIERAENVARFMDVNHRLLLDLPPGCAEQWQPLVDITGDTAHFAARYGAATQQNVMQFLAFDAESVNSILSCFRAARENARSLRDIISSEMWEQLTASYLMVNAAACPSPKPLRHEGDASPEDTVTKRIGGNRRTLTRGRCAHTYVGDTSNGDPTVDRERQAARRS